MSTVAAPSAKSVVEGIYAAFGRGDLPGLLAFLHPEIEWVFYTPAPRVPYGGARTGHAGVQEFFALVTEHEDIEVFAIDQLIAEEGAVAARGHERLRVRSTGKYVEGPFVHLWWIENGLVTRMEGYYDSHMQAEAFG